MFTLVRGGTVIPQSPCPKVNTPPPPVITTANLCGFTEIDATPQSTESKESSISVIVFLNRGGVVSIVNVGSSTAHVTTNAKDNSKPGSVFDTVIASISFELLGTTP